MCYGECVSLTYAPVQRPNMGLGMILDSAVGMFPHTTGPLLQLLTALLSNKSTVKKVCYPPIVHALTQEANRGGGSRLVV